MDLTRYVEEIKQQLLATAELGGDDARALAERLAPHLDAMVRLVLLDSLSAAADEITTDLAPGSVAVRLRCREPEFDVTPPPAAVTPADVTPVPVPVPVAPPPSSDLGEGVLDGDEGEIARVTLRLPERLKAQVEVAAAADRLSVNAWLVRAVTDAFVARGADPRSSTTVTTTSAGGQRLTGWAR